MQVYHVPFYFMGGQIGVVHIPRFDSVNSRFMPGWQSGLMQPSTGDNVDKLAAEPVGESGLNAWTS